jgi:hypothetical protein
MSRRLRDITTVLCAVLFALLGACLTRAANTELDYEARSVSSRPDTVSGGDVLVQLKVPTPARFSAQLIGHEKSTGREVTGAFNAMHGSSDLLALLTGLELGKNTLEIRVDGTLRSTLELLNHPIQGPVFSGPQQTPFICQTLANGLGPALDANCTAETLVQYYYKSTQPVPASDGGATSSRAGLDPGFKPYHPSDPLPPDVASTVTSEGRTVNYIVRRELGTINRAVFDIEFLQQPDEPLPTPFEPSTPGWNGRLVYVFGGGCGSGYHQGILDNPGEAQEPLLAQGYAVARSTLNVFQTTCNDRVSAETMSMVKEHFIKQYGVPIHTIGWGGSGGAMQMHLIAQNYPGLLDGIMPFISFPDVVTHVQAWADCLLLAQAFEHSTAHWTEQEKTAASGFASWRTCRIYTQRQPVLDPAKFCDATVPGALVYDAATNPKGLRCDIYDNEINFFGRNRKTGFAMRPLDNVGVQYGLMAFNAGKIDAEQFIELNATIGGFDENGTIVASRSEADAGAVRLAWQRGLVLTGGGGLAEIPIIDWREYVDDMADVHVSSGSFAVRARLIAANGNAGNQVIVIYPRPTIPDLISMLGTKHADPIIAERGSELLGQMDRWLDAIVADRGDGTQAARVARNRPSVLADGCLSIDGHRIAEHASHDGSGQCNIMYPSYGDPRLAAGGPLADDILKCALKPNQPKDYVQPLTDDQLRRLGAIFPTGVCDYTRPSAERLPVRQLATQR